MSHTKPSPKYLAQLRKRYAQASKSARALMLDEFVATTGYHRKHASALLAGKRQWRDPKQPLHRHRRALYTEADQQALFWLVALFDDIGSKRLRVAMDTELPNLRRQGHLKVSRLTYQHLLQVSPSTMDRWRRAARRPGRRLRGGTKPGTLLKQQIAVRTFADWDDQRPGFGEIDLVQHEGGSNQGDFACTLTLTDVATSWTELGATPNKAQVHVFATLKQERVCLPFPLLGLDSDNGSEFTLAPAQTAGAVQVLTTNSIAIVWTNTSPSRGAGRGTRTIRPSSKKRIGPRCDGWWATGVTTRPSKWPNSMRSTASIACISITSCR